MTDILAINGGTPVRTTPWPPMFPGGTAYGEEEKQAALAVIEAQSPFRFYGLNPLKQVDQLEKEYREFLGVEHALAVGSGSAALIVALAALGVGPGTEVILPGFLWVSDVNAVVLLRGIPVFAEVDETLNLDAHDLERHITPRTKAIIAVHMAGTAADMEAILEVACRHHIPVLEDCSQAAGASINGRKVGSIGAISTVSLQYNKNFTTGEGGLIATSDNELYRKCTCYHDLGFDRDIDGISKPLGSPHESFGFGTRMDELRGAVGVVQLRKLPSIVARMNERQQQIRQELTGLRGITLRRLVDPAGDSGAYFVWFNETAEMAVRFREALQAEGIPASPPHGGLHQFRHLTNLLSKRPVTTGGCPWDCPLNAQSNTNYSPDMLPKTNELLDRASMIPMPPLMTDEDARDVVVAFRKVHAALIGG